LLKIFKKSLKIHNRILETDDVGNYPKLCLWMLGRKIARCPIPPWMSKQVFCVYWIPMTFVIEADESLKCQSTYLLQTGKKQNPVWDIRLILSGSVFGETLLRLLLTKCSTVHSVSIPYRSGIGIDHGSIIDRQNLRMIDPLWVDKVIYIVKCRHTTFKVLISWQFFLQF
jgi:hypothetical protein